MGTETLRQNKTVRNRAPAFARKPQLLNELESKPFLVSAKTSVRRRCSETSCAARFQR